MFIHKLPIALLLAGFIAGPSTVLAQNRDANQPYTVDSVNGEFALVGTYTGGIARQLGVVHIKGDEVTGYLRVNVQGAAPTQRIVVYLSFTGTATIAEDGAGVFTLTVTYPDQSLHDATLDFLITKARESSDVKTATEIAIIQRETPALNPGALIVGTLTRRPERK
jgi:hypothetical protein